MIESGSDKLRSLLFGGDGELVNVKFFPGKAPGTVDEFSGAAADMLAAARDAWRRGEPSRPPVTGIAKRQLVG